MELHRRIAETLEELHANRIEEFAPLLAYHFYAAQDPRSLKYDLLAGEKAARLFANVEAATHFSRALEVAKRVGKESELISAAYDTMTATCSFSDSNPKLREVDSMTIAAPPSLNRTRSSVISAICKWLCIGAVIGESGKFSRGILLCRCFNAEGIFLKSISLGFIVSLFRRYRLSAYF